MLIDQAAAAFRKADTRYLVDRTDTLGKFNVTSEIGEGKMEMHAEKLRHDQALQLRDTLGGRDGVQAVLEEMISVKVLTIALINCGAPIPAAKPLAGRLLPAIILLLQSDTEGGGSEVLVHG